MSDLIIKTTNRNFTNHAGLPAIANFLNDSKIFSLINIVSKHKRNSVAISDYDIIKTTVALISLGKTNFDDVQQYRHDKYFKKILKLKTVPSAPTLRQRIETYGEEIWEAMRQINVEFIKKGFGEETTEIGGKLYTVIESDVTPLDNSDSKKEGVSRTYKNFDGYAPMMSYAGKSGFMINNELRSGSSHSNCEGTLQYFSQTTGLARQLSDYPLLAIMDSGNDDSKLVRQFKEHGVEFIIKRNLRNELRQPYIDYAKENAETKAEPEEKTEEKEKRKKKKKQGHPGRKVYYARSSKDIGIHDEEPLCVPIAIVVTETTMDRNGQLMLSPEYEVEVYWNSLNLSVEEVVRQYHKHGTSEQYHSEFKSDLDMERLPSGKFSSNYTVMLFGMLAFNLLRTIGKELLRTGRVPGAKRGIRLRIRTVLQNIMYMAGQYIEHARQSILCIFEGYAWSAPFLLIS